MAVHHIQVKGVGASLLGRADRFAERAEVRAQQGRSEAKFPRVGLHVRAMARGVYVSARSVRPARAWDTLEGLNC